LKKLRFDFYESGVGDTIVITFPSGGLAIVDAHPSSHGTRSTIEEIVKRKEIHFVCLTHPHEDHAADLVAVIKTGKVASFWHSISEISPFAYKIGEFANYPGPLQNVVKSINAKKAAIFTELLGSAAEDKSIEWLMCHDGLAPVSIDGVDVHFLSPNNSVLNEFRKNYFQKITDPLSKEPEFNQLSVVLAFNFGQVVALLGADALKKNWLTAVQRFYKSNLPKAKLLKVPHHGAANSYNFQKGTNYLDACATNPPAHAVIFAGDVNHPNERLFGKLRAKTQLCCTGNGLKLKASHNPLNIQLVGAVAQFPAPVCNPQITFEIDESGAVSKTNQSCDCSICFP
jgi:beta-lactamase superfamily II metal-dependent hydrolase